MSGRAPVGGDTVQGWSMERVVGSGSFATVWLARRGAETAAIKVIATERLSSKLKQSLESEVTILRKIDHPNIVRLLETVKAKSRLYLVMEYCGGGDLAGYIRQHKKTTEAVARSFIQQLGAGMKEMWLNNFVHRDLKPQNLLLSDKSSDAVLKIADFGFARDLQPQRLADTLCGSPLYMAPEILQFQKYDAKADLWSVGVILYELLVGHTPFDGGNHVQLLRNIETNEASIPNRVAASLSTCCVRLIYQLLKRSPIERISFQEFFSHPFLAPGELPPSPPSASPLASTYQQMRVPAMSTIASGIGTDRPPSAEAQLPFAVEQRSQASWTSEGVGSGADKRLERVESEPPLPVSRQVLLTQQPAGQQPLFSSLRKHSKAGREAVARLPLTQSLEEDDDYVIIERTHSSSGSSGLRGYSQSAPSGSFLKAQVKARQPIVPPPPPPLTVPLLVSPIHQNAAALSLSRSLGTLRFTSGLPQAESLQRVGMLLEDVASMHQIQGKYADSLALRLMSLQVLQSVMSRHCDLESEQATPGGHSTAVSFVIAGGDVARQMDRIATSAEQVGGLLEMEEDVGGLPDVWEVIYKSALNFAKAAAVDELLGNYTASLRSYAKAGSLFYFMFADGARLQLQPALELDSGDLHRLRRFTACVALRHQGCASILHTASSCATAPAPAPGLPAPTVVVMGKALLGHLGMTSNPLATSVSQQPPLRTRKG